MIYQLTQPRPALRPYVKEYLLIDLDFTGLPAIPTKLMPARAEQSLIFYPGDTFTKVNEEQNKRLAIPNTIVQGQPLTTWRHYYPRTFRLVKVVFQPGGLYHLLGGAPVTAFTDATLDAESVLGQEMHGLLQRLLNTARYREMLEVVDTYLFDKFRRRQPRLDPMDKIGYLLQAPGPLPSLDYLDSQSCLGYRQFERRFRERMGISPKLFTRMVRFTRAYTLKEKHPATDWLSIALACGYADYQHLVKDCKQFAGVTPVIFGREDAHSPDRVLRLPRQHVVF